METEEMLGGWLPTLDLEIKTMDDNKVLFQYFEKPMVPNMVSTAEVPCQRPAGEQPRTRS